MRYFIEDAKLYKESKQGICNSASGNRMHVGGIVARKSKKLKNKVLSSMANVIDEIKQSLS